MKQIKDMFAKKLDEAYESGKVEELIEKHLLSNINDIIRSYFSWGDGNKMLKEKVHEQLGIALNNVNLKTYQKQIGEALQAAVKKAELPDEALTAMQKEIDGILGDAPEKISMDDLVVLLCDVPEEEWNKEMDDYLSLTDVIRDGNYTVIIKHDSLGYVVGFHPNRLTYTDRHSLILGSIRDYGPYSCEYTVSLRPDGEIRYIAISGRTIKGIPDKKNLFGTEKKLIDMYYAGTKVTGLDYWDDEEY